MHFLLDTHAFLWWVNGSRRMPNRVRSEIEANADAVFVSAASAWEITTKYRLGRLDEAERIARDMAGVISDQRFHGLAVTVDDGSLAGALPGHHGDPFDRMLIAQALSRDFVLVSNEALFDRYGVRRLW